MRASLPIVLCLLALARPAAARWTHPQEIVHSTAHTLESGEWMIGVFTPIAYGATDRVMVLTHPILWVLLTPNGGARWKFFDTDVAAFSLTLDGARSFLTGDGVNVSGSGALGYIDAGILATVTVGGGVMLTASAGYQRDIEPTDDGVTFGGGVTWLMGPVDVLMLEGGARWSANAGEVIAPSATLVYAHAWDTIRIGAGLAYGDFPIEREGDAPIRVPVWPVLDVWWQF